MRPDPCLTVPEALVAWRHGAAQRVAAGCPHGEHRPAMDDAAPAACHASRMDNLPELPSRVGILVPGGNTTCEAELNRAGFDRLSFHAARMALPRADDEATLCALLRQEATQPLKDLSGCQLDLAMLGCTSAAMSLGGAASVEMMQAARAKGALDVGTAILDALRTLGLRRIALFTPYLAETNAKVIAFLAEAGIATTASIGLGLNASMEMFRAVSRMSASRLMEEVAKLDTSGAEGVLICCTDLPTMGVLPVLEARIGKPVVSSNQAMVWAIARHFGMRPAHAGGQLFAA
jgi:maleate cis-trans isomerase